MAKSNRLFVKVHLNGKTLLIITLYSALLMGIGAGLKSCSDKQDAVREKITNTRTK